MTGLSDKPPVGLRPRWLVLSDRADEIQAAIKRYDEQALICPDEWLIELEDIERQLAILLPKPEQARPKRSILGGLKEEQARIEAAFAEIAAKAAGMGRLSMFDPDGEPEPVEVKAEPEPLHGAIPRRFVSITTIHVGTKAHLVAVADDGTAWFSLFDSEWEQLPSLPAREVQADV